MTGYCENIRLGHREVVCGHFFQIVTSQMDWQEMLKVDDEEE